MPISRRSDFVRDIAKVATGTVIAQGIVAGSTPVLTRLYSPREFGELALVTSLITILAGVFTLKFELSILLPTDEARASSLFRLTLRLSTIFSLLLLCVLLALDASRAISVSWYYYLVPLLTYCAAAYSALQQWCSRHRQYRLYARSAILCAAANVAASLLLSLSQIPSEGRLVIGYCFGIVLATLYLGTVNKRELRSASVSAPRQVLPLVKQYAQFPLFVMPSALLSVAAFQLLPIFIKQYFDVSAVGLYAVASRFLVLPSVLVGGAISQVFRAEFVSKLHAGNGVARGFFVQTLSRLILIALPVFSVVFLLSPFLFRTILGATFAEAGHYARYLCLGVAGMFVAQPFQYVFIALNRTRVNLLLQALLSAAPLAGFAVGGLKRDIAFAFVASSILTCCTAIVIVYVAHAFTVTEARGRTRAAA